MLTDSDRAMIARRRRSLKPLPTLKWLLPLIWLVILVVTAVRYPLLVNPWKLNALVSERALNRDELASLATMAPILVILVQMLVIAFIAGAIAMFHREKRLLDLLEAQDGEATS